MHDSDLGAKIGDLSISCLGFADDVVLAAETPENLQLLINKCECSAKKNVMEFKISKCKAMVFNRPKSNLKFSIYNEEISVVNSYKYLGIEISNKNQTNLYIDHFRNTIEKAEKRLHCIAHFGFYRDGLRPNTAMKLYKLMVRPILEYGSQVLTYQKYYLRSSIDTPKNLNKLTVFEEKLEHLQTQALKTLIVDSGRKWRYDFSKLIVGSVGERRYDSSKLIVDSGRNWRYNSSKSIVREVKVKNEVK